MTQGPEVGFPSGTEREIDVNQGSGLNATGGPPKKTLIRLIGIGLVLPRVVVVARLAVPDPPQSFWRRSLQVNGEDAGVPDERDRPQAD
ncbi:MAG: hypothetical protein WA990_12705 [Rubrobacteraceae bacterium]